MGEFRLELANGLLCYVDLSPDDDHAESYLHQALEIYQRSGHQKGIAMTYTALGLLYASKAMVSWDSLLGPLAQKSLDYAGRSMAEFEKARLEHIFEYARAAATFSWIHYLRADGDASHADKAFAHTKKTLLLFEA